MKQQSQSSELTGSLVASESSTSTSFSESVATSDKSAPPPAIDFMYEWIRKHSGK